MHELRTLDLPLQRFAENAVARGIDRLESGFPWIRHRYPRRVGCRDCQASQFNRVTLAQRQAGSAFKPFVYLAALRPRDGPPLFTAASMVDDAPLTIMVDGKPWSPREAWFVGYSSRFLAVVWVGFDDGEAHGLSGARAALPIWADFMSQALGAYPAPPFAVPDGISFADIDTTNGKLAGTEPERCDEHRGLSDRILEWSRRPREWFLP